MSGGLPRYFALRYSTSSLHRVMRLQTDKHVQRDGSLNFDNEVVVISGAPTVTKFALEQATTGNSRLRHIRCCYNNRYLSRRSSSSSDMWITATAEKPEEDQSKWSCTLFEFPTSSTTATTIQIRHVATGWVTAINPSNGLRIDAYLRLTNNAGDQYSRFDLVDWDSIMILPEYVSFKGDNGRSLLFRPYATGTGPIVFSGEEDIGNESQIFLASCARDGSARFMSLSNRRFWLRMPKEFTQEDSSLIYAHSTEEKSTDTNTFFRPIKLDNSENKVALQNVFNGRFCGRFASEFRAHSSTATANAILEVNEAVFSRSIYNVRYRLNDARIYDEAPVQITSEARNDNSMRMTVEVKLTDKLVETTDWQHSVAFKLGVKTTFLTGLPFIIGGKVTLSLSAGYGRKWGEKETTTKEIDISHFVVAPPRTIVIVTMIATKGTCDIPFSYTKRDILGDGRQVITDHDDGVYTGVSHYDFKYETTRQDI